LLPLTDALIDKLSENHPKGYDLSLGRITGLLEKLGNPQNRIPPAIHIAGTNGKGSTLAFCRAILEDAGYRVHVHTSPHLVNWNERFRLAGKLVDDAELAETTEIVAAANGDTSITIFEIMSAVMFVLFSKHKADFSLVEVGLGGRADATNMIATPAVSVITPVSLDHQAHLGDTLAKIAFEKAGIIKPEVPVVIGLQEDEARTVIEEIAEKMSAPIMIAGQDFDFYRDVTGFVYQDESGLLDLPLPGLLGDHQLGNAAQAIAAIRHAGINVPQTAWANGLRNVSWPGRFEKLPAGDITKRLGDNTDIWIDGGHNPAAGQAITNEIRRQQESANRKLLLMCGMLDTKEPSGYFEAFAELDADVITVPLAMSAAGIPPDALAEVARSAGLNAQSAASFEDGIQKAAEFSKNLADVMILLCGSLYLVGEALDKNGTPVT